MNTRNLEVEIDIAARVDAVWEALIHAEQVAQWFAPYVQGEPGEGGHLAIGWGAPDALMRMDFTEWREGEYLRTTWQAGPADDRRDCPVEFWLTATETGTRLRLVHSGFLSDASWDDEFDSHGRGWAVELRHLRYYLETQAGRVRAMIKRRVALPAGTTVEALLGPGGWVACTRDALVDGQPVEILTNTGERMKCTVLHYISGKDCVLVCDRLQGGLLRLTLETSSGAPELWLWALSWSLAEDQLAKHALPWLQTLEQNLARNREPGLDAMRSGPH